MAKSIKIIATLLIVGVMALVVVISTLDVNQYKAEIIEATEQATGRQLQIGGDLEFALSLVPTVIVEDVKFSNASWGSKADMLSLDKFELEISLLALLSGNIQINRVILLEPEILLETNKKGLGNWVFASKKTEQENSSDSTASNPSIVVHEIHLKNAKIAYKDGVTGKQTTLVIDKFITESDSVDKPLSVVMEVAYNELAIDVKGTIGSLNQLTGNTAYPIDLSITFSGADIALQGEIEKPMDGKGLDVDVNVNIASLANLSKLTGSKLPKLGPVSLSGKLTDNKDSYSIKTMKLVLGNTDISGDLTANISAKRPAISANLNSNLIDLVALTGDQQETGKKDSKQRLFSSEPLPFDGLKSVNANLIINAQQIKTSSVVLEKTKLTVKLKEGNLVIKPLNSIVAGGDLSGNINLNASGKTALLTTEIKIKGFEPSKFGDLKEKISGLTTDINLNIKGSGNSVNQIMAGLDGKLILQSAQGVFKGANTSKATTDLLTMLNPTAKSSKGTQIECAVVNFNIKAGIATADKGIALVTNQMNIIGSGTVDLKTEQLDIGINPQARQGVGISAGQLADLVRLGGTLANPEPTTDVKAALTTGLSVGTAVATGGLSILAQGLLDRATADQNPCATALGVKAPASETKKEAEPASSNKAVDTVKDAGSATLNKLKSLF